MISKRVWIHTIKKYRLRHLNPRIVRAGWFLFGFIPLYIYDLEVRP